MSYLALYQDPDTRLWGVGEYFWRRKGEDDGPYEGYPPIFTKTVAQQVLRLTEQQPHWGWEEIRREIKSLQK